MVVADGLVVGTILERLLLAVDLLVVTLLTSGFLVVVIVVAGVLMFFDSLDLVIGFNKYTS